MGTRNLTMVILKKETKVAQYGQWDGYPSGQGATVVDFIKNNPVTKMIKMLERVKFIDDEKQKEIDEWFKSIGVNDGWMNMEQSAMYQAKYPLLTRDNGANVLNLLMESEDDVLWLHDSTDFAADSLFCEWAYVLDLDKRVLEVYTGFNKGEVDKKSRFADLEESDNGSSEYKTVSLLAKYRFKDLKGMTTDEWATIVEKIGQEEEEEVE